MIVYGVEALVVFCFSFYIFWVLMGEVQAFYVVMNFLERTKLGVVCC